MNLGEFIDSLTFKEQDEIAEKSGIGAIEGVNFFMEAKLDKLTKWWASMHWISERRTDADADWEDSYGLTFPEISNYFNISGEGFLETEEEKPKRPGRKRKPKTASDLDSNPQSGSS